MVNAKQVYEILDSIFPFSTQEHWDNSGILIDSGEFTEKIVCCLDVTNGAIEFAKTIGAKLIVSHHPVIFSGIKKIDEDSIVYQLVSNGISVISAHTNFDKYEYGTCYNLAKSAGLQLLPCDAEIGLLGECKLQSAEEFAEKCKDIFGNVGYTDSGKALSKVFVCAGSGSGMTDEIIRNNADAFLTGECKYHDMLDLREKGVSVFTLGHDVSEKISVGTLERILCEELPMDVVTYGYYEDDLVTHIVKEY